MQGAAIVAVLQDIDNTRAQAVTVNYAGLGIFGSLPLASCVCNFKT